MISNLIYSTKGVLQLTDQVTYENHKTTFFFDISDPVDFLDDDDFEDFQNHQTSQQEIDNTM